MSTNVTSTSPGTDTGSRVYLVADDGACAEIELRRGLVTSWRPAGGADRLFLSRGVQAEPGLAGRGGVPVVFPQFSIFGPLPKHGFARSLPWTAVHVESGGDGASARIQLRDRATTRTVWPHAFQLELEVRVGGPRLEMALFVTNTGDAHISFTAALHTYLRVVDLRDAAVLGLGGRRYVDAAAGGEEGGQEDPEVRFGGEVDRIYYDAPDEVVLREPAGDLVVRKAGFPDVVVWNPGPVKASTLADLEPGGYLRFVCIEAVALGRPVVLEAGERWSGAQVLVAR